MAMVLSHVIALSLFWDLLSNADKNQLLQLIFSFVNIFLVSHHEPAITSISILRIVIFITELDAFFRLGGLHSIVVVKLISFIKIKLTKEFLIFFS